MGKDSRHIMAVCMLHKEPEITHAEANCQRRHGRVRLQTSSCSAGEILDMSKSGMKIRTRRALKPSLKPIYVQIATGDDKISLPCRVAWSVRSGLFHREAGLEFAALSDDQSRSLTRLARTAAGNSKMASKLYGHTG